MRLLKKLFSAFCFLVFCLGGLFALDSFDAEQAFVVTGTNWKLYRSEGLVLKTINRKMVFALEETRVREPENLELWLDFENKNFSLPNYKVLDSSFLYNASEKINGAYSAKFYMPGHSISLMPMSTSIFAPGSTPGSFTIDFWIYFYNNANSQYVLRYVGNNLSDDGDKNTYGMEILTRNNRLVYNFLDFFWDRGNEPRTVTIQEDEPFAVNRWEHHAISYNNRTGKMTTFKNGVEQQVLWITESGRALSAIFNPFIKEELASPLRIGDRNALFSLDNMRVTRNALEEFYLKKYESSPASLTTDVYRITTNRVTLKRLQFQASQSAYSHMKFAYRLSESYFTPDNKSIPWVYAENGLARFPESQSGGKYIQYRAEVYPYRDDDRELTLTDIRLEYTENLNPAAPLLVSVVPLDGAARISWIPSPEDDVRAYEIYYGNRSGDYVCYGAADGPSPVRLTNLTAGGLNTVVYTLTGLANEEPYFIALRSVDRFGQKSGYSREFYVRPSTVKNENGYSLGR